eukprot:3308627-Amphidinium_carterae.1
MSNVIPQLKRQLEKDLRGVQANPVGGVFRKTPLTICTHGAESRWHLGHASSYMRKGWNAVFGENLLEIQAATVPPPPGGDAEPEGLNLEKLK